ncbi:non-ribosomal peptide synthetase [Insolitispirillum peregrinum]|uniref:Amino acid adenylation domain-containing protein n=1 Tax=Insolitispirillum peregrinum TaxID=80876 RepID=A0A1N7PAR0_9PROT|nr:non-ribosomal peptide synthetase [Insolitispirillum peregrinum]SIT07596.1 amino acid adenylation domain-containing protein [Insolitispirillum peregrinum]
MQDTALLSSATPVATGPLTISQRRLWALVQTGNDRLPGDQVLALRFQQRTAAAGLENAITEAVRTLVARHATLRSRLEILPGGRVDVQEFTAETLPGLPVPLTISEVHNEAAERAALSADYSRAFHFPADLPWRVRLVRSPQALTLCLTLHPLIADSTSLGILAEDLLSALAGQVPLMPAAATSPTAHARAERQGLQSAACRQSSEHWRGLLQDDALPPATLPPRVMPLQAPTGDRLCPIVHVPLALAQQLRTLAGQRRLPLATLLSVPLHVLLARYSGHYRHVLGRVHPNRPTPALHRLVGRLEDIAPVVAPLTATMSFADAATSVQAAFDEACAHPLPYERLAQEVWQDAPDASGAALQTLFSHQPAPAWMAAHNKLASAGLEVTLLGLDQLAGAHSRADAALVVTSLDRPDGGITVLFNAAEDSVDPALLYQAAGHWLRLLAAFVDNPQQQIGFVPLLSDDELATLSAPYPDSAPHDQRPLHQRISAVARRAPERVAILCGDQQWTFGDLETAANRLAHHLIAAGVGPEQCVAVLLKRSPAAIIGILAVLKAGAAFVPVDPDHPDSRNHHILQDARVRVILTESPWAERIPLALRHDPAVSVLLLDHSDLSHHPDSDPAISIADNQLAYVIYTSGSTGAPKGVAVDHGPLARHLDSTATVYEMDETSRELPVLPFSSDGGHERWMVPLMLGGSIVLPHKPLLGPDEALELMHRHGVTNASLPTSYVHQLAEWADLTGAPPPARLYSFGGEAMAPSTFAMITRALRADILINGYGPTETIMTPMVWKVAAGTTFSGLHVPIGRPVGQRRAYILDANGQPVPPGVVGELYLGGDGVARGYVGRPDLTSERFVPDPFSARLGIPFPGQRWGERLYKTGDLARWQPDGMIDFIGRADQQVKLRGYRIELGEIESVIKRQPAVREAVVVLHSDAGQAAPMLVAYVVAAEGQSLDPDAVRTEAARTLPDYMVPTVVMVLPALPLTANSKLDRKALPAPGLGQRVIDPPTSAMEQMLCEIWRDVLGLAEVGIHEDYFQIGGNSIAGLKILARIKRHLPQASVAIVDLFNNHTIADLAAFLERGDASAGEVITLRAARPDAPPRPMLYCFPGLLVSTREYLKLIDYLGPDQPATGFVCYTLCEQGKLEASIADISARYADHILRRSAGQPVVFLGWSWGGLLAYETARLLAGKVDVRLIGMVDVCDMDTDFALGAIPSFAPGERDATHARVQDWLGKTRMRAEWETLLGSMDALAYEQFLSFVLNSEYDLPLDGPAVGSTEHIFWVLIDNALVFRQHQLLPHDVPIQSFAAEDTLHRGLNLIDWRQHSRLTQPAEIIAGTTHLHIIGMTAFHSRFARRIDDVVAELSLARRDAAE